MASSRKSLSDFFGLSWSSWADYNGEFTHSDGDEEDKSATHKKTSDVMRLYSSDMQKFGLFPETDCFCTVVCSECGALVKPQGLLTHMRVRHKELLPGKNSSEKISKQSDSPSIKNSADKALAKMVLNEKLMSKLILNEKHSHKTLSDKLPSSPSDRQKSNIDKTNAKYSSSDKTLLKSSDKILVKSTTDKLSRSFNEKVKASSEKCGTGSSLLIDKSLVKIESDKFSKSLKDSYSKQHDTLSSKVSKFGDKLSPKSVSIEKPLSKYASSDSKISTDGSFGSGERFSSRSGEKSVKSVLSEKLLSKVAASEKGASLSDKNSEYAKNDISSKRGDSLLRTDRVITKPVMKSLLKEKVLRNELAQNVVPGGSLLRPLVHHDTPVGVALTTLSPPVLTPQNLTQECHSLAADMPVLSRKRKHRERKSIPTQYDPDRHCGVWCDYSNKFCVRSLTCKVHSVALRRAVVGRSKAFDQLLIEHKRAKEDQRQIKEDQDELSETSPQLLEQVLSPSEPSSPYVNPVLSPESIFLGSLHNADEAVTLCTPSTSTSPPTPLPSYQYPPYPPPDSAFPSLPETVVSLSPHLSSPLLNVALPSLSPSHAPRPPDSAEDDYSKYPRTVARALNRLQLNKGRQFNVKHTAFPPKPLRTCLFQGRKSSGMFLIQRELESMRTGFRVSVVRGNKSLPLSHLSHANQSTAETGVCLSSGSTHISNDVSAQNLGLNTTSQLNMASGFKSVMGSICTSKAGLSREGQQRLQRTQKAMANGPESLLSQPTSSENTLTVSNDKLPQSMSMRIPVPTTVPQQIAYLTTATPVPVTFQQVPIINSQVLSQLQLQSKAGAGTLKLLSTSGGGRTLLVHQYQDGSGAES